MLYPILKHIPMVPWLMRNWILTEFMDYAHHNMWSPESTIGVVMSYELEVKWWHSLAQAKAIIAPQIEHLRVAQEQS